MYRLKSNMKNLIIIFADCISIVLSLMLSNLIRHESLLYFRGSSDDIISLMAVFLISYFLIYLVVIFNQDYLSKDTLHELLDITKMQITIFAATMIIIYFTRIVSEFSREVFIYFFIIDTLLMLIFHTFLKYFIHYYYKQSSSMRQLLVVSKRSKASTFLS